MKRAVTHRLDDTYIEKAWKHAEMEEMEEIEKLAAELLGKAQEGQSIEDDLFCMRVVVAAPCPVMTVR
jgi:hypothetical protein